MSGLIWFLNQRQISLSESKLYQWIWVRSLGGGVGVGEEKKNEVKNKRWANTNVKLTARWVGLGLWLWGIFIIRSFLESSMENLEMSKFVAFWRPRKKKKHQLLFQHILWYKGIAARRMIKNGKPVGTFRRK